MMDLALTLTKRRRVGVCVLQWPALGEAGNAAPPLAGQRCRAMAKGAGNV